MLRREPFRLFFPLGILIGAAAMLPWFLFGRGTIRTWPGLYHSLAMPQAFLLALAVGFLGTMVPRRAGYRAFSAIELVLMTAGLAVFPVMLWRNAMLAAQVAFIVTLAVLCQYVVRAFFQQRAASPGKAVRGGQALAPLGPVDARGERKPIPPSFVLVPLGLLAGLAGSVLLTASLEGHAGPWAFPLGRQLAQQAFLLLVILGLVPMLAPIFATGEPPADPAPARAAALRGLYAAAGVALVGSYALEQWGSPRVALLGRGVLAAAIIVGGGELWRPSVKPGAHRFVFRLALWAIPIGLLAAGVTPGKKVQLLHVTYAGGFSLLAFAVSVHVSLLHTGHDDEAERRPWPVVLASILTLAAAAVRVAAERYPKSYFESLTWASGLWLAAALVWIAYLTPRLASRERG